MSIKSLGSNQTLVCKDNGTLILVSYSTPVAAYVPTEGYYRTDTKFSTTTSRHINKWCAANAEVKPQSFFASLIAG